MKKLFAILITNLMVLGAFCQVRYSNFQDTQIKIMDNRSPNYGTYAVQSLDSNFEYRNVKDGIVMQGGQLKLVRNGNLYRLDGPVSLKNGAIVMTDGIIRMTNGSTPSLNDEDFIDMDGNIRPLQRQMNN
ncbi:MAG TPA: DUF6799 domain-containing protein [Puia sp.]